MIVVSDTSPINYLILIGEVELLSHLYGSIVIPQAVYEELTSTGAPDTVRRWVERNPTWLKICEPTVPLTLGLDRGEQEAITLAIELNADLILIDERRGRTVAQDNNLLVIGTLGVLAQAAKLNLILLPDVVRKLRQTSYQISEKLINTILEHDRIQRS